MRSGRIWWRCTMSLHQRDQRVDLRVRETAGRCAGRPARGVKPGCTISMPIELALSRRWPFQRAGPRVPGAPALVDEAEDARRRLVADQVVRRDLVLGEHLERDRRGRPPCSAGSGTARGCPARGAAAGVDGHAAEVGERGRWRSRPAAARRPAAAASSARHGSPAGPWRRPGAPRRGGPAASGAARRCPAAAPARRLCSMAGCRSKTRPASASGSSAEALPHGLRQPRQFAAGGLQQRQRRRVLAGRRGHGQRQPAHLAAAGAGAAVDPVPRLRPVGAADVGEDPPRQRRLLPGAGRGVFGAPDLRAARGARSSGRRRRRRSPRRGRRRGACAPWRVDEGGDRAGAGVQHDPCAGCEGGAADQFDVAHRAAPPPAAGRARPPPVCRRAAPAPLPSR